MSVHLAFQNRAHVTAKLIGEQRDAVRFALELGDNQAQIECPALMGRYNVYNCLAATTMALQIGVRLQAIIASLKNIFKGSRAT